MSVFDRGTDFDQSIPLPNRFSAVLRTIVVRCECGGSPAVYNGEMANHFPPMYEGHPAKLKDPFWENTAICRYSGRTVTAEAAIVRDEKLTRMEFRARAYA